MRGCSVNDAIMFGGTLSDYAYDGKQDEVDCHNVVDPLRTRLAKEQYLAKIVKIASLIRTEEVAMEGRPDVCVTSCLIYFICIN